MILTISEINDNLDETSELDLEVDTDDVVIDGDEEHYANNENW